MKNLIFILIALLSTGNGFSQEDKKVAEIVIQTSAECGKCKKLLEETLNYTKGVRYSELDIASKKLTVSYSPKKITADQIRTIISEKGYDADNVPANPSSQNQLPKCCQPGGME